MRGGLELRASLLQRDHIGGRLLDGKRLAFYGTERDGISYDVYVVDVGSNAAPRLVAGGQQDTWYPLDWSPDDRKLLLWKYVSINESYLYIADVYTGTITPVDPNAQNPRAPKVARSLAALRSLPAP